MLRPAKMAKIRILGTKSAIRQVIDALETHGGTQIKKVHASGLANANPFEGHDENVAKLLRIEAIISKLGQQRSGIKISQKDAENYIKSKELREIDEGVSKIAQEMESIDTEMESLKDAKVRLKRFSAFAIDFGQLKAQSLELRAGIVPQSKRDQAMDAISKIEGSKFTHKENSKQGSTFIVAIPRERAAQFDEITKTGFEQFAIPEMETTAQKQVEKVEAKMQLLEKRKEELRKEIAKIGSKEYAKIAASREILEISTGKSGAASMIGATEHSFILEAYIPEKELANFREIISKRFANKIELREFSAEYLSHKHEETPTLLENPKILSPFEFMTKFVSLPKSNELDPTIIFTIFFPIFYGMMVGDVVYGLLSFLLAKFLLSKVPKDGLMDALCKIWMWSAIPTIIFGFIFDEYAGVSHTEFAHLFFGLEHLQLYHGLERIHNIPILLAITILVGVATVAIGFALGFLNAMSHGNKKHMVAKAGWFGITVFGSAAVATIMYSALPAVLGMPFAALTVICLLAVIWAEGFMGLIELPSVMGNILSFARIIAVGLVGAIIATILHEMAFPSLDKGLLIIVFLPLYIAGHLMNVFLAMFESLIQGARLNYVEFYSKFYEGGGKEFSPFKFERKFTKD